MPLAGGWVTPIAGRKPTDSKPSINYERNETTSLVPLLFEETTSDFGGTLTAFRKLEVSEWRFSVGRSFIPTGDNGKSVSDRFRIQYDRLLSQRLSFTGAARYDSRSGLSELDEGNDRDYARLDLSMKWFITQKWYVGGGYSYIWEDREQEIGDADNNRFFINFGYQGLSQRVAWGTPMTRQDCALNIGELAGGLRWALVASAMRWRRTRAPTTSCTPVTASRSPSGRSSSSSARSSSGRMADFHFRWPAKYRRQAAVRTRFAWTSRASSRSTSRKPSSPSWSKTFPATAST